MKTRVVVVALLLGLGGLLAVFFYSEPEPERASAGVSDRGTLKPKGVSSSAVKQPISPQKRSIMPSSPEVPPSKSGPKAQFAPPPEPGVPAPLTGLELIAMDDGRRAELEVPDDNQLGYGVVVGRIHPDAPAAEVFLKPADVIVRAQTKKVNNIDDLYELVGEREQTLLTISRQGHLFQVVIKQPFERR